MLKENIIKKLKSKKLIVQLTNENRLIKSLLKSKISFYCGFDPSSDSLHVGHLVLLLILKYFQKNGHKPFILIGGATALIGDPSFRFLERKINSYDVIKKFSIKIKKQISYFLEFNCGENSAEIINNYDWFKRINFLNFLTKIGKYFSVNKMIRKESIQQRFKHGVSGISYSEFSYNLLQSYDFFELNKKYNVRLQIGGSDQWGNIISGIELIRKLYKKEVFGLTVPLITDSHGLKISKTSRKVIWLDPNKTSPYNFYQYWINISDADTGKFLNFFSIFFHKKIISLKKEYKECLKIPKEKYILADLVTELVHGKKKLYIVKKIVDILFFKKVNHLKEQDFYYLSYGWIPIVKLKVGFISVIDVLMKSKFSLSKCQARRMISSFSIEINNKKCIDYDYCFSSKDRLFNQYSLIKKGKKNYCLIVWK